MPKQCRLEETVEINKNEICFKVPADLSQIVDRLKDGEVVRGRTLSQPGCKSMRLDLLIEQKPKTKRCSSSSTQVSSARPPADPGAAVNDTKEMNKRMCVLEQKLDFIMRELCRLEKPCKPPAPPEDEGDEEAAEEE